MAIIPNPEHIHVYKDFILKVVAQTEKYFVGFNISTEECLQVDKKQPFFLLGNTIIDLLADEGFRVKLAIQINPKVLEGCKILGIKEDAYLNKRGKYYTFPHESKSKKKLCNPSRLQ